MYLKRLEIHGFKSFAQKTTLEFSKGIIAIVGPNGSGKSNVADALRWVLGEQSPKLMRGKKSEDVIFAGSDKKVRLGFAEVVATFDNSDRRIALDTSEVSIGRRVDRSGQSDYLINGQSVRLLDVVDLLLKSGIGTSRYTVIGQGTIDQMILAGPSEVKNLLDEASGVKTYYIKREKTLRRLEQTAQNLMRAEDLIKEIEPRLKSLKRQARKMEARAEIETQLRVFQREFFGKTYWNLKQVLDRSDSRLKALEEEKNKCESQLLELRRAAETEETKKGQTYTKFNEIREDLSKLQQEKNKLLEDLSLIRGKMQSHKTVAATDTKTLQVEEHQLKTKLEDLNNKILQSQTQIQNNQQTLRQNQIELETLSSRLNQLYGFLQNPNTIDWEGFHRELVALEAALNDFYGQIHAGQPWETVKAGVDNFKGAFFRFKQFVGKTFRDPQAAANIQQELKRVLTQKDQLSQRIQSLEVSLSRVNVELEFLQKEQKEVRQALLHTQLELKKSQSHSLDDFVTDLITEEDRIKKEVEVVAQKISKLEQLFKEEQESEVLRQKQLHEVENHLRKKQDELSGLKDEIAGVQIEKAKFDTQMELLAEEVKRILGEEIWAVLQQQPVESTLGSAELEEKIYKLKSQLDTIGGMDELTLKEFQETEARYTNLSTQVGDLKQGMADLRQIMDELDEHIKTKFNEAFHKINEKFEYYFRVLFNGGRAYLSVLKAEDQPRAEEEVESQESEQPAVETLRPEEKIVKKYEKGVSQVVGIDIKATPPGKKLSSIQALSGGERSLTSIALLCSLLACFPSPFVVLDEVDAALDDANTIRFGQILGMLAGQTQFLTITHNRETMAQANILYGVTMGDDGVSKLLSVKLEQAKAYAK